MTNNRVEISVTEIERLMAQITELDKGTTRKLQLVNDLIIGVAENPDLNDTQFAELYDVEEDVIRLARNRVDLIRSARESEQLDRIAREYFLSADTIDRVRGS